jgi:hypothetical protein
MERRPFTERVKRCCHIYTNVEHILQRQYFSCKVTFTLIAPLRKCVDVRTRILQLFHFIICGCLTSDISFTSTCLVYGDKYEFSRILPPFKTWYK